MMKDERPERPTRGLAAGRGPSPALRSRYPVYTSSACSRHMAHTACFPSYSRISRKSILGPTTATAGARMRASLLWLGRGAFGHVSVGVDGACVLLEGGLGNRT